MIYTCDNCHFVFSRVGRVEQCPDCGKFTIRPANEGERKELNRLLKEDGQELFRDKETVIDQLPDFCQTSIKHFEYFTFDLPMTAFGVNDSMIMEFCVDYGKSPDGDQILANIWTHQRKTLIKYFVYALAIADCQEPDKAIIKALNSSERFRDIMTSYICEVVKHRIN